MTTPPDTRSLQIPDLTPAEHEAHAIVAQLRENGHDAYTVGGAVRDRLLARQPMDVDVATSATPEQVARLFRRTVPVGAAFGVIIVVGDELQTEVATFRIDGGYIDGRHPDAVEFSDARNDAERRDFTINALFYDPLTEQVIDFVGGLEDLARGRLRTVGDPVRRFGEDYLRMLRAIRFATRYDFVLSADTAAAIAKFAAQVGQISNERIYAELTKMLIGPHPHKAIGALAETGLLEQILPEVTAMRGVKQPAQFHPEGDVWVHTLLLLSHMAHPCPVLAWGVLLHDVGKPPTFEIGAHGRESFPGHASVGAEMAESILRRLKCSKDMIEQVRTLVHYHMSFAEVKRMRPATLRRMIGRDTFTLELELHRIDCMACHQKLGNWIFLLDAMRALGDKPAVPEPLVTGRDLLARGMKGGPEMGTLLRHIHDLYLDGQFADRAAAMAWLDDHHPTPDRSL
ncbi:MAG: poly(A) polymerase [Rhodothermales bacterium]|jgi:poly(A) polymerase